MKKFKTIDELHSYLERKAKRIIKSYYTDWKNYDRPALMKATGDRDTIYIIFRSYGSYLYTEATLLDPDNNWAATVMDYYINPGTGEQIFYYKVDLKNLTVEQIPAGLPKWIKEAREAKKIAA